MLAVAVWLRLQVGVQEADDSGPRVTGGGLVVASAVEQPEGGEEQGELAGWVLVEEGVPGVGVLGDVVGHPGIS